MPFLQYTCQFCDTKGTAEYADDCPPLDLAVWRRLLCCNPCADFERERRKIGSRIARLVFVLENIRQRVYAQELFQQESNIRGRLTALTRDYARLLSRYYRKPELWDEQFVDWLMDPEKSAQSWKILGIVRAQVAKSMP